MTIIFDCDGVVIDSTILHTQAETMLFNDMGVPISQNEFITRFSGVCDADVFRALERDYSIKIPDDISAVLNQKKKALFAQALKATQGMQATLDRLGGVDYCIASGSSVAMLEYMLSLTGLLGYFEGRLFSSDMVERGKPFPDVFLYAAQQMNTAPRNCIVIEDSIAGVKAGKAAGCYVVGFMGGSHCTSEHYSLLKSAGADQIIEVMDELPPIIAGLT